MKQFLIKKLKFILLLLLGIIIFLGLMTLIINIYVINYSKKYILDEEEIGRYKFDCITVLGASVKADGTPSHMLQDRLDKSIVLYNNNISDKILMSGDHAYYDYDEVNAMKNYNIKNGIPSSDIFLDHAGISTYDSMYRLKNIYEVKKTVIVTQDYHLYRSIFIARKLGIEAYGVTANPREYSNQIYRDAREILARVKDFFQIVFKAKSKYAGDTIPVIGDGDVTNNKR
ncbi:MAG TPA: ElyC/SanA/YdcF family protein [Bacilli bacterium]|nr:ElyC/SanA/YdcF family protein [Bacilli bacterium]